MLPIFISLTRINYTVKSKIDDHITQVFDERYEYTENSKYDYIVIVLGILIGIVALLSYFHKVPWPHDAPIIATAVVIYYILYWSYSYVKNTYMGTYFVKAFCKDTLKNKVLFKSFKDMSESDRKKGIWVKIDSQVGDPCNIYEIF